MSDLLERIKDDVKLAMKAGEKERVAALRLILSTLKQREIDERKALDDQETIALLDRMAKQRRESIAEFEKAGRADLVAKEQRELELLQGYLPTPLEEAELEQLVEQAIADTGAAAIKDMGKVMGVLKPAVQGRADMAAVSARVKQRLS